MRSRRAAPGVDGPEPGSSADEDVDARRPASRFGYLVACLLAAPLLLGAAQLRPGAAGTSAAAGAEEPRNGHAVARSTTAPAAPAPPGARELGTSTAAGGAAPPDGPGRPPPEGQAPAAAAPDPTARERLQACRLRHEAGLPSAEATAAAARCAFGVLYPPEHDASVLEATYNLHGIDGSTAHIYGEIPPGTAALLGPELRLDRPGGVFYDLGSGVGRLTLQVFLTTNVVRSVGVEVAELRHNVAASALAKLQSTGVQSLLPEDPPGHRRVEFLSENFTNVNISDATAIYMASLFFPKDVMWFLAEKLSALRDGTRIASLVKFPFDVYGTRHLPKDSPLQALRLRQTFGRMNMSWGEDNNVFLYEVDRREAFEPPFDFAGAEPEALLEEVFRRATGSATGREQLEVPSLGAAVFRALQSLRLGSGDVFCELGSTSGWLPLRVALGMEVTRVAGVCASVGGGCDAAAAAAGLLGELAPSRVPWHRRVDIARAQSLDAFVRGDPVAASARLLGRHPGPAEFESLCGGATVVLFQATASLDGSVDVLVELAQKLAPGTVLLVLGLDRTTSAPCTPGLLSVLEPPAQLPLNEELGLATPLAVFVVAPTATQLAKLKAPQLEGSLLDAVRRSAMGPGGNETEDEDAVAGHLLRPTAEGPPVDLDIWSAARDVEPTRQGRLPLVLGGLVGSPSGELSPPAGRPASNRVPARAAARLHLARLRGGMDSAYACLEANVYASAPYAPAVSKKEKAKGLFPQHSATYGEVDPRGLAELLERVGGVGPSDVFFDLGSGLGKVPLQLFLGTDAGRVVGIELAESRHRGAVEALVALRRRFPDVLRGAEQGSGGGANRTLELIHGDVLTADIAGATLVWMGSLAFPPELMGSIAARLLALAAPGCRVLTMLAFPESSLAAGPRRLELQGTFRMRVRWSDRPDGGRVSHYVVKS